MPLWRMPGGGSIIRGPMGGLAGSEACCCAPATCETEGQWSLLISDLDGAWMGNLDLGPHILDWDPLLVNDGCDPDLGDGGWTFSDILDACSGSVVTFELRCCNGEYQLQINQSAAIGGQSAPWFVAVPYVVGLDTPPLVYNFVLPIQRNAPCWFNPGDPLSGAPFGPFPFRLTLTRV